MRLGSPTYMVTIIVLLIAVFTMRLNASTDITHKALLVRVVDGDTVVLKDKLGTERRYRLAGIDTPESYKNKKALKDIKSCKILDYKYLHLGLSAKDFLKKLIKPNDILTYKIIAIGRYRRPIIIIGTVNNTLVRYGWAEVKDYGNLSKEELNKLYRLEDYAKRHKIGIWGYLKNKCY